MTKTMTMTKTTATAADAPISKTCEGFEVRVGHVAVALSACCSDQHYCIDVSEMQGEECLDNDHDTAGLPIAASPVQVERFLRAALANAQSTYATTQSVRRSAFSAATAGNLAADQVPA